MSPLNACLMAMTAFDATQPLETDAGVGYSNKARKATFVAALRRELEAMPPEVSKEAARRYLARELESARYVGD